jgi:hypothetical protein
MELVNHKTIGYGMVGAGGLLFAASFMPTGISPAVGTPSTALMMSGLAVAGLGATTVAMGKL